jgi:predicted anti-sigma-YlaC factor YlaD
MPAFVRHPFVYRWHPSSEQLSAWIDGNLGGIEHVVVTEHIALCQECYTIVASTLDTLEQMTLSSIRPVLVPLDTALRREETKELESWFARESPR